MLRLEAERLRKGWSKAKLAREADLHETTVCEATTGKRRPGASQLDKLARALGFDGAPLELLEECGGDGE